MGAKITALLIKSITFLTMWLLSTTSLLKLPIGVSRRKGKRNAKQNVEGALSLLFLFPVLLFKFFFPKTQIKPDTNVK